MRHLLIAIVLAALTTGCATGQPYEKTAPTSVQDLSTEKCRAPAETQFYEYWKRATLGYEDVSVDELVEQFHGVWKRNDWTVARLEQAPLIYLRPEICEGGDTCLLVFGPYGAGQFWARIQGSTVLATERATSTLEMVAIELDDDGEPLE